MIAVHDAFQDRKLVENSAFYITQNNFSTLRNELAYIDLETSVVSFDNYKIQRGQRQDNVGICQREMKLKKDRVCRKCYIFLFETIKSVSINCLSGTAKYGHTCDTQNFRHSMNHLVVFTLKTWEQILDAFYISATHVSTPKRCLNLY